MGRKLGEYIDPLGNTVRDGDKVIYEGKEYSVIYISDLYVNLLGNGGLHLPFSRGYPVRKEPNKEHGPVRKVTLREIVSGQFGLVKVEAERATGNPRISMNCVPIASELRRAIKTLEEIVEAMEKPYE